MQYWIVTDGAAVQIKGGAPEFAPEDARVLAPDELGLVNAALAAGKTVGVVGGNLVFADPPMPNPAEVLAAWRATAEVSRFQAFAALYADGKLDDAEAAVAAAGGLTVIAWQNAQVFKRSSPMMNALAPALGLDDEALDDLFLAAALIEA